jgi:membrane protease YdiL (CAAX protease family)
MTVRTVSAKDAAPESLNFGALLAFFLIAYACSWVWVIPLVVSGQTVYQGRGWPTHFPSLLGPLIAAFVVTAWTTHRAGVRDLVHRMGRWRIGWPWWVAALSPVGYFLLALASMSLAGESLPALGDFARFSGLSSSVGLIGVVLLIVMVNGYGEETGWRGYALPQLQLRFTALTSTLILAAAWAGWHIPQFLLLHSYANFTAGQLVGFVLGLACGAVVATWIYNHTEGSILALVVWHGVYNALGATEAATGGPGTIAAVVSTCIMIQGIVLVILELRARRHARPSVLGAPS